MEKLIVFNKTKIVATVGPASNNKIMLSKLMRSGVDVFRLNFSHGTHEQHLQVIQIVRELNEELGTNVSLLQDLQGPKIRTNLVENGEVWVEEGNELIITSDDMLGNSHKISTSYTSLPVDVNIGDTILIDDGKIELRVKKIEGNDVITDVVYGGPIKSRKGINLPDTKVSAPSLTEKDEEDLQFGLKNNLDWVALSFVRTANDIKSLQRIIEKSGNNTKVVAKIEKPEALINIDEIIEVTDALMVARGDLGVEIAMEEVPMVQKMLISKCNKASKPVIVATQMLESMIENPRPTRAEANDVANAVMDGADAVMLSAESASGKYPAEAVRSMSNIIASAEKSPDIYYKFFEPTRDSATFIHDNLVLAACQLSKQLEACAILGMTKSGYTGLKLAHHRPKANIFIFTSNKELLSKINLIWGVRGFYYDKMVSTDDTFKDIEQILVDKGLLNKGDVFINTASMPIHWEGRTNIIKINIVE